MNILIIGSGGREHALAWKIRQSPQCQKLFVAPGNAGTSQVAENVAIPVDDFPALGKLCVEHSIGLVVIGPEVPLVKGLRDHFEADPQLNHIPIVGPGRSGARLEGSKDFSKAFMLRHGIPTAQARTFTATELSEGLTYLAAQKPPVVLKADGLAAGKGVVICQTLDEAQREFQEMLGEKKFGDASSKVLVEQFLSGIELSVFILTDGTDYVLLPEAKDYKRIGDGDTGPNTGGMGSVSPVVFADSVFLNKVKERIIAPTLAGLKAEAIAYRGFIFIGLMNVGGDPFVIEYNARLGDPETQSVMSRIEGDLVALLHACARGELGGKTITISPEFAVTVVMAAGGYPGTYGRGATISGLGSAHAAHVFHAGTRHQHSQVVTDGGRVLAVTGRGRTLAEARAQAYETVQAIRWEGAQYRKDIGLDLINFGT